MQRAATGLATVCLRLLGAAYGRRVALLVGTGNNGGDALFAGAAPRRAAGRGSPPSCSTPTARTRPAWPRCGGPAAGVLPAGDGGVARSSAAPTWCSTACSASAAAAGCAPDAAELARAGGATARGITVAVDVPSGIDADTGAVDGDRLPGACTRSPSARSSPAWSWARAAGTPARCTSSTSASARTCRRRPRSSSPTPTSPRRLAPPSAGDDKYSQGVVGDRRRLGDLPRRRRAVHRRRAAHPAGPGPLRRARRPTASGPPGRRRSSPTAGPADAGRVQAWVVGPGMGTDDDARERARRGAGHRPAGGRRRRRADDAGRRSRRWSADRTARRPC